MEKIYTEQESSSRSRIRSGRPTLGAEQTSSTSSPSQLRREPPWKGRHQCLLQTSQAGEEVATSSMWIIYSHIRSVLNRKYGVKLQSFPRVTMFIKDFHENNKHKAAIFV
jgi:hypothetical protein